MDASRHSISSIGFPSCKNALPMAFRMLVYLSGFLCAVRFGRVTLVGCNALHRACLICKGKIRSGGGILLPIAFACESKGFHLMQIIGGDGLDKKSPLISSIFVNLST